MIGQVDNSGRALVTISIQVSSSEDIDELETWIDTGFNGDLVLPRHVVDDLALPHSGTVKAILADGSEVALKTYACLLNWFGEQRHLEVVANDGEHPLLGVGLLWGHDLSISYRTGRIQIE